MAEPGWRYGRLAGGDVYEYEADLLETHDGDTVSLRLDLGVEISARLRRVRLAGINAPELPSVVGLEARNFLAELLPPRLLVRTVKGRTREVQDKWGRYLVYLLVPGYRWANRIMVDTGHAVPMGPYPVDPPG